MAFKPTLRVVAILNNYLLVTKIVLRVRFVHILGCASSPTLLRVRVEFG
nr:MAG TPA: hypothetical protein [Caudoviricetes sp.]